MSRGHPGRGHLSEDHRHRGLRARWNRHSGEQRGVPDGADGWHRRHHHRAVRPGDEDQPVRHVLALPEGHPASEARIDDHQHLIGAGRRPLAGTARLRHHQGRHPELHQGPRRRTRREGHPGERGRPRSDLDPADPGHHAARTRRRARRGFGPGPRGTTGRGGPGVRVLRLAGVQLHHRGDARGDRRQARHLDRSHRHATSLQRSAPSELTLRPSRGPLSGVRFVNPAIAGQRRGRRFSRRPVQPR